MGVGLGVGRGIRSLSESLSIVCLILGVVKLLWG